MTASRPDHIAATDIDSLWLDSIPSEAETNFAAAWVRLEPELDLFTEVQLIPDRMFRFDFVFYPGKVAIEIQGMGPGHYSIRGVERDNEKQRLAHELGWMVIQLESRLASSEDELKRIARIMRDRVQLLKLRMSST